MPNRVDLLFRAFSDRTRLRILNLLRGGELCVCDLIEVIAAPQAKISRHLAYLRNAGLVRARKEGLWQHYSLIEPRGPFHAKLMECLQCCFTDVPELVKDARRLGRKGQCTAGSERCGR
jgi:ArsR family transcriptional regulator, arsenate/arsenite/antimonite-responsive transcriptional repressor